MQKKPLATLAILVILLVSLFGSAAAQTGVTPSPEPTDETALAAGSKFFTHPIVQILGAYFGRDLGLTPAAATPTVDPSATVDPNAPAASPTPAPLSPQDMIAQQIAAYHEQGMGFGVLVKLYAMAEASQIACTPVAPAAGAAPADGSAVAPACTVVTVDQLVTDFKSGSGMGQLFKEYGKPALLGVGHVKKALRNFQAMGTPMPALKGKGHNK